MTVNKPIFQTCSRVWSMPRCVGAVPSCTEPAAAHQSPQEVIKLVSYNILAQCYVRSSMYPESPRRCLKEKYRKELLMSEIKYLDASIMGLQELSDYKDKFESEFSSLGYSVSFKPRTCVRKGKSDGSAVCWKRDEFECLEEFHLEFNNIANQVDARDLGDQHLIRDNISAVVVLKHLTSKSIFIVASSHFYWSPECKDVKLLQAWHLMDHLENLQQKYATTNNDNNGGGGSSNVYTLVLADTNSMPNSSVYELLTNGRVDSTHPDLQPDRETNFKWTYGDKYLTSKLSFTDLYEFRTTSSNCLTNITPGFSAAIDYIFINKHCGDNGDNGTSNCSYKIKTLQLLTKDTLESTTNSENILVKGLPSIDFPSDHLSLVAELCIPA